MTGHALPRSAWPTVLGEDLTALVTGYEPAVASITPLVRLDAGAHRSAAFRIELENGSVLKGRRAWDAQRASRIAYFLCQLEGLGFPGVLASRGAGLLLDWVEGEPLRHPVAPASLGRSAALLARLHGKAVPPDAPFPLSRDIGAIEYAMRAAIARLVANGHLPKPKAAVAAALAAPPDEATIGLIHTDFCPENLVQHRGSKLCSVDNESLQLGYLAYDLARCWYRWPLQGAEGAAFIKAYEDMRESSDFREHFPFWFISVLTEAAVYRLDSPTHAWQVPLLRLLAFLDDPAAAVP